MFRRKWPVIALLTAAAAAAIIPACNLWFAVRLMLAVKSLASGSTAQDLPVLVQKASRQRGDQSLECLFYRPDRQLPERAVVLVAGISELGCYHPRLIALSRSMADRGFLVVTPDVRMFRQFRMSMEALDEIQFWFENVRTLEGGGQVRQVGLAGISFSGTLALITAARPELRERVAWVLGIGAYDDPLRCGRAWFASGPVTMAPGYFPTRFYARWIIMHAAADMLPRMEERQFIRKLLEDLLLQRRLPDRPEQLSPEAERWYRLAVMREDQEDAELARQIEDYLKPMLYDRITPDRASVDVRCPVFLVHGAQDDLIPPDESRRLHERMPAKSHLLVSPFLTHTHPNQKPLGWRETTKAAIDILGFFYEFARVAR